MLWSPLCHGAVVTSSWMVPCHGVVVSTMLWSSSLPWGCGHHHPVVASMPMGLWSLGHDSNHAMGLWSQPCCGHHHVKGLWSPGHGWYHAMGLWSPPCCGHHHCHGAVVTTMPWSSLCYAIVVTTMLWSPLHWHSPMASRACLSSSEKATAGTLSHTGSTATVERLLVGLMGSELEAMPKPEPT